MKAYVINRASSYAKGTWSSFHMGVHDGKWCDPKKLVRSTMELNTSTFWIGPGKVYVDVQFPLYQTHYIDPLARRYMYKGCTCLLIQVPVTHNCDLEETFSRATKTKWDRLPIDYMFVPRISLTKLNPNVILFYGRKKVPFIVVTIANKSAMYKKAWEWIAQAQHPSYIPITPVFTFPDANGAFQEWKKIADMYGIRTLPTPLGENPLSFETLKVTGIYPYKGEFIYNGDADYNLYPPLEQEPIEAEGQMFYHNAIPYVTVLRGNVIRATTISNEDGLGQNRSISIPNHFM
ncbi:hypothetical protein [Pontibacillus litoralis]|uniref:Uncharacterized protein n=1 Tax=Pontibacillus litoralis JSM 072002 TaxID=1385512 RepID=A0A0A5GA25_9BACI|nr:hypothetical protein [Pontibacillus litoralis]KGX88028.1 hypothetical protein N784_12735 [Pontibacillus litoralis JSM 072002]